MNTINRYLFVYGTLLAQGNKHAQYLHQHCTLIGRGKLAGKLYNIGEYPGAKIDLNGSGDVYGCIYLMDDAEVVLNILDVYEGISADEPKPHEYIRELVKVDSEQGTVSCWMYIYNWPVNHLPEIIGGKYWDYINQGENKI